MTQSAGREVSRAQRIAASLVVSVGAIAAATAVTWIAQIAAAEAIYVFYIAAVAIVAWAAGTAAGVLAAVLSTVVAAQLSSPSVAAPLIVHPRWAEFARLASFAVVGVFIAASTGALRRARNRAERLARGAAAERLAAEDARDGAERANAAKSRFLAMMSHEFRTPLNAVLAYAELLEAGLAGPLGERQRQYVQRMQTAADHLLSLVTDILDMAKLESGHFSVEAGPVALGDAIGRAVALVQPQADLKEIRLVVEPAADPIVCHGDANRIRQIVVNLVANGIKFTPAGGTVTLSWGLTVDDARVWVRVRDTGIGIAPADHGRVFEPFEQASEGTKRAAGGTGLGLPISRALAAAMGGALDLESAPGCGATFTLWLSAQRRESPESSTGRSSSRT